MPSRLSVPLAVTVTVVMGDVKILVCYLKINNPGRMSLSRTYPRYTKRAVCRFFLLLEFFLKLFDEWWQKAFHWALTTSSSFSIMLWTYYSIDGEAILSLDCSQAVTKHSGVGLGANQELTTFSELHHFWGLPTQFSSSCLLSQVLDLL